MARSNQSTVGKGMTVTGNKQFVARFSEIFWFLTSLLLFVVLGPFSGPIAILILFKEGLSENVGIEPEPLKAQ